MPDVDLFPLLYLNVVNHDAGAVVVDNDAYPIFMTLGPSCPLVAATHNLLADMRRVEDKLADGLTTTGFKPELFTGVGAYSAIRVSLLRRYSIRLSSLLAAEFASPFDVYLELASFLADLTSFDPQNSIRQIIRYDHRNQGEVFRTLFKDIRSFLMAGGGVSYVKLDFIPSGEGVCLGITLRPEHISIVKEAYIALQCRADPQNVIRELQKGDTFKLINPRSSAVRARGVRVTYAPYPPRFLPILRDTQWFKLELGESVQMWRQCCEERGMLIDYAPNLFPDLSASLYIVEEGK
jgi:predicted component of type VI protein secretion system